TRDLPLLSSLVSSRPTRLRRLSRGLAQPALAQAARWFLTRGCSANVGSLTMTTEMVDWALAVSLGSRLAGAGPQISSDEAEQTVAELRAGADRSTSYVREFTGLEAGERTAPVLVIDRPAGIPANAHG